MSTEQTTQETTKPLDRSMQQLYDFLPESEKSGESPEPTEEGDGSDKPEPTAEAPAADADKPTEETTVDKPDDQPAFDLNKFFEESSEGIIKSADDFKGAIDKIKGYDDLVKKNQVLESEKETIFANDFIKKLNSLHKEGKSQEQIDSFMNLSKMDLASIDPKEALVQNEILKNGHSRALAERLVNKRFGLDMLSSEDDSMTPEEIAKNKEDLELAKAEMANAAKPVIEQFKKELEELGNEVSPEQKALEEAARKKSYEKALKPFAEKLTQDFPKQMVLEVEEGVKLTYDIPSEVIDSIEQEATEYFNHPDLEVNAESVNEFMTLKKALFMYSKAKETHLHFYEQGKAAGKKEATAEFENRGGLERPNADVNPTTSDNIDEQLYAIAKK